MAMDIVTKILREDVFLRNADTTFLHLQGLGHALPARQEYLARKEPLLGELGNWVICLAK